MKKPIKILLIIAASFAGLGLLLTLFGTAWSLRVADRLTPEESIEQSYAVDCTSLTALDIDTGIAELNFQPASDQDARVEASGFSEGELIIEQTDGVLSLRSRGDIIGGSSIVNLGFFRIDWLGRLHTGALAPRVITLYLPQTQLERFTLNTGVGNISGALPFSANTTEITCGTGSVSLSALHTASLHLTQGTGAFSLEDFSCDTLALTGGTGRVILKDGSVMQSANLSVGTGQLILDGGQWQNLHVEGSTGSFQFTGSLRGAGFIQAGTGSITLNFDDSADHYAMRIHKALGAVQANAAQLSLSPDEQTYTLNTASNAENTLEINMALGSVTLNFPE